ncbi:MAG TPA: winged helix-turn-helix domain-containing protein [Propionibacteriaceae bacterium]|nr:winged helix-turn-helix domain-containing protein [Propionibacteriaceae bacterium]
MPPQPECSPEPLPSVNSGSRLGARRPTRTHRGVGPASATQTHLLRIHVGHLRHKLEDDPANPRHVVTVNGLGYRFEP